MDGPKQRRWIWFGAVAAVVALAAGAQVRFALLDSRLPLDANHCYQSLGPIYHCLGAPADRHLAFQAALTETTGWYNLALAAGMRLAGRGPGVMRFFALLWVCAVLAGMALVAWRLRGPPAALAAVVLVPPDAMWLHQLGRSGWIHVPELALALLALGVLAGDPGLARRRTVLLAGLTGLLAATIRPSGAIWVATLVPLVVAAARGRGRARTVEQDPSCAGTAAGPGEAAAGPARRPGRAMALLGVWALAAVPLVHDLPSYLEDKLEARPGYEALISPGLLVPQVLEDFWFPFAALCVLGVLVGALPRGKQGGPGAEGAGPRFALVLGSWLLLPPALGLLFNVGLTNFPCIYAAMAVLGAAGFARLPRPLLSLPAALWLTLFVAQLLPQPQAAQLHGRIPEAPPTLHQDGPLNYFRPYNGLATSEVLGLLRATCPRGDPVPRCKVLVDRGLFHPSGVDPGGLGLFLLGQDQVRILEVRDLDPGGRLPAARALARFVCPPFDNAYRERYPGIDARVGGLVRRAGYQVAWQREIHPGCSYLWLTRPWGPPNSSSP